MRFEPVPDAEDVQRELALLERDASRLRYFLPAIPTGLIQTPAYMRHVMTRTTPVVGKDVEQVIARKLKRQAVLDDLGKRFEFLLTESAIRWQLCEEAVMARQVEHLVSLSHRPNIDIKVLPLTERVTEAPFNTFTLYDTSLATLEVFTGRVVLRETMDIAQYDQIFGALANRACVGDAARRLLAEWAEPFDSRRS